jgi:uncharacterized protein (DUF885 family)
MTVSSATDARRDLHALADEAWERSLAADPLYATAIGDRSHLTTLAPNDDEGRERERGRLETLIQRVTAVPDEALVPSDRVTRSALLDFLDFEWRLLASDIDRWTVDQMDGPQVEFLNVESYQPIGTVDEGAAAIERWRAMGPWLDRHVAGLHTAAAGGLVAPRTNVANVIDELDDLLSQPDREWPLLAPAAVDHEDWPAPAQAGFRDGLGAAVADVIRPAFERLRAALADGILPSARPDEQPGLCHLRGGEAAYAHLVRAHTTLPVPPTEIHRTGLDEVARIDGEFAELGARVLDTRGTAATIERLRSDPSLRFRTSDEVRTTAEAALRRATEATPAWFGRLPVAPCEVVVMGPHESKHSTIAYYRQPSADGTRPGRYYINTTTPDTRPRYEAECLAFHEAVPGHHLQVVIAQELDDLPPFQRFGGPTAFMEGWALYAERLSDEMGLYSGDLDRFGILSFDAWRACRLVVDTGIHALGWSRSRAIEFMLEHTALAQNNIENEVDRYVAVPGQALAYKSGQMEIVRLRHEAEAALGGAFDVREFHDVVLGRGAVGLGTLRRIVGSWIEAAAAR